MCYLLVTTSHISTICHRRSRNADKTNPNIKLNKAHFPVSSDHLSQIITSHRKTVSTRKKKKEGETTETEIK
jgi:hypothetical protein